MRFKKIYIEITNICNLNCFFCPDTKRVKKQMNIQDFENIIQKIYKYTKIVCLHVKGEPLLHNNLKEILAILEKYQLKANITTNGTLLKEKLNILQNSKAINQINISLHSLSQNNIDNNEYLDNLFTSLDKLKNIKISLRLWNLSSLGENDINSKLLNILEKHFLVTDLNNNLKDKSSYKIRENLYINEDIEFTWPSLNGKVINEKGRCLALKDQIAILVDGTVTPCCLDNEGDIKLGNINLESFEDILNKPLTKMIKNNFANNKITCDLCKTCGFLKRLENKRKNYTCQLFDTQL